MKNLALPISFIFSFIKRVNAYSVLEISDNNLSLEKSISLDISGESSILNIFFLYFFYYVFLIIQIFL